MRLCWLEYTAWSRPLWMRDDSRSATCYSTAIWLLSPTTIHLGHSRSATTALKPGSGTGCTFRLTQVPLAVQGQCRRQQLEFSNSRTQLLTNSRTLEHCPAYLEQKLTAPLWSHNFSKTFLNLAFYYTSLFLQFVGSGKIKALH